MFICLAFLVNTLQVLELLWDLAHLPSLSTALVEQALDEHHAILSDSYSVKEQIKMQYVNKCVEDIKKVKALFTVAQILSDKTCVSLMNWNNIPWTTEVLPPESQEWEGLVNWKWNKSLLNFMSLPGQGLRDNSCSCNILPLLWKDCHWVNLFPSSPPPPFFFFSIKLCNQ